VKYGQYSINTNTDYSTWLSAIRGPLYQQVNIKEFESIIYEKSIKKSGKKHYQGVKHLP